MQVWCKMCGNTQPCLQVSSNFWVLTDMENCWEFWKGILETGMQLINRNYDPTNKRQSTDVSHWSVLIAGFRIHPGIWVPSELYFAVIDSFPLFAAKSQMTQYIQILRWPMSTHAPWLESICFPGYHLGFRKHSFMVAGLLPVGPMVINQGSKWYPPLRLLQTLCVRGAAGGLVLDGCFLIQTTKKT